jgi:hypothetical protein
MVNFEANRTSKLVHSDMVFHHIDNGQLVRFHKHCHGQDISDERSSILNVAKCSGKLQPSILET